MTWNHRVIKTGEEYHLAEVYYNEGGKPNGWGEPFMLAESMEGLQELLVQLKDALNRPVLDTEEDFEKDFE